MSHDPKKNTYFHMENGAEDRFSLTYGPFEFVQLTYGELRIGPNGDPVGFRSHVDGFWHLRAAKDTWELLGEGKDTFNTGVAPPDSRAIGRFSDVVIYGG